MSWEDEEDTTTYKVIRSREGGYRVLALNSKTPVDWREAGKVGTRKECLNYIEEVWTDRKIGSMSKIVDELKKTR
jgi:MbtH protein